MADVFISYKRDERAAIEHLAETLRGLGLSVWFDASLTAGESFSEEIDREAREAKAILVCWSPTARESRWVRAEAMIGFEQDRLAACYVGGPDNFSPPAPFNSIHAEDLRAWLAAPSEAHGGWKSVLRRLGKLCGRADVEAWGALDAQAAPAELKAWIAKHGNSPLRAAADTLLHEREQHYADRAAREQAEKDKRAKEKADQKRAARARWLKPLRPWLIGAGVIVALLVGTYFLISGPAPIAPVGEVAATVNGRPIYVDDVRDHAIARELIGTGDELDLASDAFNFAVDELIEFRLFAMEAEARGLDRSPEISRQIRGMTPDSPVRDRILAAAIYDEIDHRANDPAEIERLYRENVSRLDGQAQIRLAQIQVATEAAAQAARRRLDQGEAFDALALEISADRESAANGGDLGFQLESELVPSVRDAFRGASVGAIVGPVQLGSSWLLLRLVDRRASGVPSLEELRPRIVEWLRWQEVQGLRERLERNARIERRSVSSAATEPAQASTSEAVAP